MADLGGIGTGEVLQMLRSHEDMDNLQFRQMAQTHVEIKSLISEIRDEMRAGFKSYDGKFWSLAVTVIAMLTGAVGTLVFYMLTK